LLRRGRSNLAPFFSLRSFVDLSNFLKNDSKAASRTCKTNLRDKPNIKNTRSLALYLRADKSPAQHLLRKPWFFYFKIGILIMKDFTTYLSTAPVVAAGWFTITAGLLIEINRFFHDVVA
jgi:photosystem I subunit 9